MSSTGENGGVKEVRMRIKDTMSDAIPKARKEGSLEWSIKDFSISLWRIK